MAIQRHFVPNGEEDDSLSASEQVATPSSFSRRTLLRYIGGTAAAAAGILQGGAFLCNQWGALRTYVKKEEEIILPMPNGCVATSHLQISYAEDTKKGGMRWAAMEMKICVEGPQEHRDAKTYQTIVYVDYTVTSKLGTLGPILCIQTKITDSDGREHIVCGEMSAFERAKFIRSICHSCADEVTRIQQDSDKTDSPFLLEFSDLEEGDSTTAFVQGRQSTIARLGLVMAAEKLRNGADYTDVAMTEGGVME